MQKLLLLAVIAAAILGTGSYVMMQSGTAGAPSSFSLGATKQNAATPTVQATPAPLNYDIDSPSSITVVVNKQRPIPLDYKADDLFVPEIPLRQSAQSDNMHVRRIMEQDLLSLYAAAQADGVALVLGSAYRSSETQSSLYSGYVASSGQVFADLTSARAGYSEHQTGLAIDFTSSSGTCFLEKCFADTAEGAWLAARAPEFGFILRYPLNRTAITGYDFEPWHFRYVGREVAQEIQASGQTLEEFFGLPAAPDYQ